MRLLNHSACSSHLCRWAGDLAGRRGTDQLVASTLVGVVLDTLALMYQPRA